MSKDSALYKLMVSDLPNLTYQKRFMYRPPMHEIKKAFKLLNKEIFEEQLPTPTIQLVPRTKKYYAMCIAKSYIPTNRKKSDVIIQLSDKWICKQWMITILAHEMCHQWQWDVLSHDRIDQGKDPIMSHGPSFFLFRERLAEYNIALKRCYASWRWYKTQSLFRC